MGLEGKFSTIAKYLGQPIFHQGGLMFEQTFMEDPFAEEEEIPTMDEEEKSYEVGLQFDGLSSGINMTISVEYHLRIITCRFEGKIVYREVAGELEGYAPYPEWEDRIESLASIARKAERKQRPMERMKLREENTRKRNEILEYLRNKWGL
jgi:hypothetical protein